MFVTALSRYLQQQQQQQQTSHLSKLISKAWQSNTPTATGTSRLAKILGNLEQDTTPTQTPRTNYRQRTRSQQSSQQLIRNVSKEVIGLQEQMNNDLNEKNFEVAIERFQKFVTKAKLEAGLESNGGVMPQKYKLDLDAFNVYFDAISNNTRLQEQRIEMINKGLTWCNDFDVVPNARSFNNLLRVLQYHRQADVALNVLRNQQQRLGAINFYSYFLVINAQISGNRLENARDLLGDLYSLPNFVRQTSVQDFRDLHYSVAVKAISTGQHDIAIDMINKIEEKLPEMNRFLPLKARMINPFIYVGLLGPAADHDRPDIVIRLLACLNRQSVMVNSIPYPVKIDQGTLLSVFNFAARQKDVHTAEMAFELLQKSVKRGCFTSSKPNGTQKPNASAYHAMIMTYSSVGQWEKMFAMFEQLEDQYPEMSFSSPYGSLTEIANYLSKDVASTDSAYFELENRLKSSKKVTTGMLNVILASCAQAQADKVREDSEMHPVNRTFATFEEYGNFECDGNVDSFNCLIEVCGRFSKRDVISSVLDEMKKNNIEKNQTTYELIFIAFSYAFDEQGMQVVLNDMKRYNYNPTPKLLFKALQRSVETDHSNIEKIVRNELSMMGVTQIRQPMKTSKRRNHNIQQRRIGNDQEGIERRKQRQKEPSFRQRQDRIFKPRGIQTKEDVG